MQRYVALMQKDMKRAGVELTLLRVEWPVFVGRLRDHATVFDREQRNALYRELGEILYEEQPYTWLWNRPRRTLIDRGLRGVRDTLLFWQFEDWWWSRDR